MKSKPGFIVPEELPEGPLRDTLVKLRSSLGPGAVTVCGRCRTCRMAWESLPETIFFDAGRITKDHATECSGEIEWRVIAPVAST